MRIHKLRKNEKQEYVDRIAKLHIIAFPDFFLTQLGYGFLKTLYKGYIEDSMSGIIIAEKDRELLGFIAYSKDYSTFFKGLLKKHFLGFALYSMIAAARHPSFIKRLLGAFKKSDSVEKNEKYVELASICVDPRIEGKGVGTKLIDYLKKHVDFDKFEYINLETDADCNDSVNKFYVNNGFVLERVYTTAEGRKMNEYRYAPGCVK